MSGPEMADVIRERFMEWIRDPEFRKRHEEIMRRKYEAWRDRESNRKLVD